VEMGGFGGGRRLASGVNRTKKRGKRTEGKGKKGRSLFQLNLA
jgi:hypothetical protein